MDETDTRGHKNHRFFGFPKMNWATKARNVLVPRIWFTKNSGEDDDVTKKNQVIVRSMNADQQSDEGCWPELKEFCKAHVIECSVFGLFILFGFFCIFNAFGFLGPNELTLRNSYYEKMVIEHCQFVENRDLQGSEGRTDHPNATLISILAAVRHGDRFGLYTGGKCSELSEQEAKEFEEYLTVSRGQNITSRLNIPPGFENLQIVPGGNKCQRAFLSPRGAIQEFALGRFLYSLYKDTPLFDTSETPLNLKLTFSKFQRTFASGIALVSGLLDQNQTNFATPIQLTNSSVYYGCTDAECNCDNVIKTLLQTMKAESQGLFQLEADRRILDVAKKMFDAINYSSVHIDPLDVIDNLVAGYVCQRKELPCNDQFCTSFMYFGDVLEYFNKQSAKMFNLNLGVDRQYRVLNSYPILRALGLMAEGNEKEVQLFSSHDTIIGSILRIITDSAIYNDWQLLAARVVFEVYETPSKTRLLRVLHNGVDITSTVKFCKSFEYGLCPLSGLQEFLKIGIFEVAGFKSFEEETCKDHRTELILL